MKYNKSTFIRAGFELAILGAACFNVQAATIQVQPNSNYFSGWQMAKFTTAVPTPTAGTPINATVAGVPFTINTLGTPPANWATWGGSQSASLMSSTDLPANIGIPTDPGNVWEVGAGEVSVKFQSPVPPGTTIFSHDIDRTDAVEYRFYRCDGTQVDASSVDFLQIATANNPNQTPPVANAADSFWELSSVGNVYLNGTTAGLVVNATDVCEIRAKELGLPNHTTVDMMLGLPPADPLPTNDSGTTDKDSPVTIDLRSNDSTSQPANVGLGTPTISVQPANGTVTIDGSGNAVYTPNAGFTGSDTFTYQVCTQYAVPRCAQATVTITVNDLQPTAPVINDASYTTQPNTSVNGNAGTGGQVPSGSTFQTVTPPAHGQLTIDPATGAWTYTPSANFTGTDTATVRTCLPAPNSTVCDDAVLTFNVQDSGVGSATTPVPTLGEWALIGLATLIAMLGWGAIRRRQS